MFEDIGAGLRETLEQSYPDVVRPDVRPRPHLPDPQNPVLFASFILSVPS